MSKVLSSLPVGERVGIAFSGGLDTSVLVTSGRPAREKGPHVIHLPVILVVVGTAAVVELVKKIVDDGYDAGKQQLSEQS